MKRIIFTFLVASLYLVSNAQSDVDALRFSMNQLPTTARSLGSGGAFGALGADLSAGVINPAGFGVYRSNQFVLSGAMLNSKTETDYLGSSTNDNEFNLNIPNIGLVFSKKNFKGRKPVEEGWIYTNFSLGMNRTNSFSGITNYSGVNGNTSMLDYFAQRAQGLSTSAIGATDNEFDFGFNDIEVMAWEAFLIDSVADRTYGAAIDPNGRDITQKHIVSTSGSTNEYHFALAANYSNKFYLGGGLTVSSVRYEETDKFREIDDISGGSIWDQWMLERNLETRGVGVSGRLGLIIKPVQWLRAGLSLQTPTILNLKDRYYDDLYATLDDGSDFHYETKDGEFDYKVVTPLKSTVSAAAVLGKKGFVSTDIEFVDYSTMRLRPTEDAFEVANDLIRSKYANTVNFRLGGEYVWEMYRFRAGYAHYGSPFSSAAETTMDRNYLTAGIGIRDDNWALDLAMVHQRGESTLQPYALDGIKVSPATTMTKNNQLVITLSSNF